MRREGFRGHQAPEDSVGRRAWWMVMLCQRCHGRPSSPARVEKRGGRGQRPWTEHRMECWPLLRSVMAIPPYRHAQHLPVLVFFPGGPWRRRAVQSPPPPAAMPQLPAAMGRFCPAPPSPHSQAVIPRPRVPKPQVPRPQCSA